MTRNAGEQSRFRGAAGVSGEGREQGSATSKPGGLTKAQY